YLIDPATGRLTLLNTASSEGASPAHISVHPSGKYVFVANYQGGTVAVLPVRSNGELGVASDVKQDSGAIGSTRATSGPPGSFAISGHDKPHAHMIQADPAASSSWRAILDSIGSSFGSLMCERSGSRKSIRQACRCLPATGRATSLFIPAADGFTRFKRKARRW